MPKVRVHWKRSMLFGSACITLATTGVIAAASSYRGGESLDSGQVSAASLSDRKVALLVCGRTGFSPENLAAAGATGGDSEVIVRTVLTELEEEADVLRAHWAALLSAKQADTAAKRTALSPPVDGSVEDLDVNALEQASLAAEQSFDDAADAAMTRALAVVPSHIRSELAELMATEQRHDLPPGYRGLEWTPFELNQLRSALKLQESARSSGEPIPFEAQQYLNRAAASGAPARRYRNFVDHGASVADAFSRVILQG